MPPKSLDVEEAERRISVLFPHFQLDRDSYVHAALNARWRCTRHDLDFEASARKMLEGVLAGICPHCRTEILLERRRAERSLIATDERLRLYAEQRGAQDLDVIRRWREADQYRDIGDALGLTLNQVTARVERFRHWASNSAPVKQPSSPVELAHQRNKRIGERIRQMRHQLNLSTRKLSKRMDGAISTVTLNNYELGLRRPGIEEAMQLCELFGVSPAWLLCIDDRPPPDERELELIRHFRRTDERGRETIFQLSTALAANTPEKAPDVPDP